MKTKDFEHLEWIHNRIVDVYGESMNVDFLIKMREIIEDQKNLENSLKKYFEYVTEKVTEANDVLEKKKQEEIFNK